VDFLLGHQQFDVRSTNHGLRRLADAVEFFESQAEGVAFVEEANDVVPDE